MAGDQPQEVAQSTSEDRYLIVEQIADTVLGDSSESDLRDQVAGAARSYDQATAVSLVHSLVEHVAKHPDDPRPLDALIILGFAHPKVVKEAGFQLVHEGRRLAGLLEREAHTDRAQALLEYLSALDPDDKGIDKDLASIMRRTGNVDRLVDRYVHRAEEAVADGRRRDAITWLREVLMLDRSRRDVARMIRDLQYADRERKESWSRRVRTVLLIVMGCGLVAGVIFRELHVQRLYANLAEAQEGNLDSLQVRLASIDALIAGNPLWLGMFQAGRDRSNLRIEINKLEARLDDEARIEETRRAEHRVLIDSIRTRGLLLVQQGNYEGALEQFDMALAEAPEDWAHRERAEADVAAIRVHLAAEAEAAAAAAAAAAEASEADEPATEETPDEGEQPEGVEQA